MKRFSCICIAIVMLFVGTAAGFAENKQSEVGNVSKIEKGGYDLKGKEFSVSLPAHGNEFVELKSDLLGSIQLSLPDAVHQASPVALPGGVVKYDKLNLSCPNVPGKPQIAYDFETTEKILGDAFAYFSKPLAF